MTLYDEIDKHELKELLIKNWMTHDGMWFYHCCSTYGIDAANTLNKAAIRSLAGIEVARIRKLAGGRFAAIETFEQLAGFVDTAFSLVKGDFMEFNYSFPSNNIMAWRVDTCFAREGMKRIGVEKAYECGLLHRVKAWLDCIGVRYEMKPEFDLCMMNSVNECRGEFVFYFT